MDTETLAPSSTQNITTSKKKSCSFSSMVCDVFKKINFKIALFLFVAVLVLFSNVYIENILSSFDDVYVEGQFTTKGMLIQSLTLAVLYLVFDLLVQGKYI